MTNTEYINHILQTLETPLWGKWELKDLISASPDSAVFGLESRRMNRTETAVLKIVPLTASKAFFTEEQKQEQIAKAKEKAEQESELLYRLQGCTNIVTYLDEDMQKIEIGGQFEGYAYLIRMEALERIADCIRANRFSCAEDSVIRLAKELTAALQFAHSLGIMHRNIQPDKSISPLPAPPSSAAFIRPNAPEQSVPFPVPMLILRLKSLLQSAQRNSLRRRIYTRSVSVSISL